MGVLRGHPELGDVPLFREKKTHEYLVFNQWGQHDVTLVVARIIEVENRKNAAFRPAQSMPTGGRGRPPFLSGPRQTNLNMTDENRAIAAEAGGGNLSHGVRVALAFWKASNP